MCVCLCARIFKTTHSINKDIEVKCLCVYVIEYIYIYIYKKQLMIFFVFKTISYNHKSYIGEYVCLSRHPPRFFFYIKINVY